MTHRRAEPVVGSRTSVERRKRSSIWSMLTSGIPRHPAAEVGSTVMIDAVEHAHRPSSSMSARRRSRPRWT